MSEKIDDGRPAFPHWDGPSGQCFSGMSLRAYIATAALQGLIASGSTGWKEGYFTDTCKESVQFADALLAELAKERT